MTVSSTRKMTGLLLVFLMALLFAVGAHAQEPVVKAKALTMTPRSMTLYAGNDLLGPSKSLIATVKPAEATGALTFTSSKSAVATVDEMGVVTPHKPGTTVITCRTNDGSKLKRTCKVTVKAQKPTAITLSTTAANIGLGDVRRIDYTITPANACNQAVKWKSSNPSVVKVSSTGEITALKVGKATITATTKSGSKKAKCVVTVDFTGKNVHYVVIGQADYQSFSKLPASADDARRFNMTMQAASFNEQSKNGDVFFDQTGAQMHSIFGGLRSRYQIGEDDVTYIFYSGHGAGGDRAMRGALCGIDFSYTKPNSYVTIDQLRVYLDQVPGTVVLILDSCMSGQAITAKGVSQNTPATKAEMRAFEQSVVAAFSAPSSGISAKATQSIIENNPSKSKYKILVACKPMQLSWATTDYSGFTRFLCETGGITGLKNDSLIDIGAIKGDTNKDGFLSVKEAYSYTNPKAIKWCKQFDVTPQNMLVWPTNDSFPLFARVGS